MDSLSIPQNEGPTHLWDGQVRSLSTEEITAARKAPKVSEIGKETPHGCQICQDRCGRLQGGRGWLHGDRIRLRGGGRDLKERVLLQIHEARESRNLKFAMSPGRDQEVAGL